ncbi:MAG: cytochrome-c peroxidase [Acidobacteriia bacterium]|nr:cytochrome-c peroxidase [Terriglobia bacterium]
MKKFILLVVVILFFIAFAGISGNESVGPLLLVAQHKSANFSGVEINPEDLKLFQPLPEVIISSKNPLSEEKIALGRMLYFDKRLSRGKDISCNDCHQLDKYGVDNESRSKGFKGQLGGRNSPTVYNAAAHVAQFWDGRAPDVEEQAKGPVLNPVEMAMPDDKAVVVVLKSIPGYMAAFMKAFPEDKDPMTYDNVGKAIGAFERKLVTASRWDDFLKGDKAALTNAEKIGFNKFMEAGCQKCHSGSLVGAGIFAKLGTMKEWPDKSDPGRYQVTRNNSDRMRFKVSSLRNVEKTAPYYHDGSVATLDKAVDLMAEFQLGKSLSHDDVRFISAWLKTLTGRIPVDYVKPPELPPDETRNSPVGAY